jgi:hypothetical protein
LAAIANSVGTNECGGTWQCGFDGSQETWNQRPEIGKPVGFHLDHNDGDRSFSDSAETTGSDQR